jgi:hypothetical protein
MWLAHLLHTLEVPDSDLSIETAIAIKICCCFPQSLHTNTVFV